MIYWSIIPTALGLLLMIGFGDSPAGFLGACVAFGLAVWMGSTALKPKAPTSPG